MVCCVGAIVVLSAVGRVLGLVGLRRTSGPSAAFPPHARRRLGEALR